MRIARRTVHFGLLGKAQQLLLFMKKVYTTSFVAWETTASWAKGFQLWSNTPPSQDLHHLHSDPRCRLGQMHGCGLRGPLPFLLLLLRIRPSIQSKWVTWHLYQLVEAHLNSIPPHILGMLILNVVGYQL